MQEDFEKLTVYIPTHRVWERQAVDAFAAVLQDVGCPDRLYGLPASQGLTRLLTLAGRLPFGVGVASLTAWEVGVLQSTFGNEDCLLVPPGDIESETSNVLITHSKLGKLSLYEITSFQDAPSEVVIGGMRLSRAQLEAIEEKCVEEQALEDVERKILDQLLFRFENEGIIVQKVAQVADWVDRVESVYVYVDRHVFSRSDVGNTLLRSGGILANLCSRPVANWSPQERLFVAAVHVLFRTGRSIRLEEFNGQRLSAIRLREWVWRKLCSYHVALGREVPPALLSLSTYDIAEHVGQLATEVDATDLVRMRRINGLNMVKTEHLLPNARSATIPVELPPLLHLFATRILEDEPDNRWTPEEAVEAVTRKILKSYPLELSMELLAQFVERMILSAVLEADADYGMSSSIRNPWCLKGTSDCRAAGALGLAKGDFFCCVMPHPRFAEAIAKNLLFEALYSSALRMEFNRWHFIAGNFPREEVPTKRHYYFPPMMPDITEWSDLRHSGHTSAGVRYTIRVPGPSLWTPPFIAFGHGYRGCYDIRLVRTRGPVFTKHELWIAIHHCAFMGAFWRAIQEFVEYTDHAGPLFTGFTRQYYADEQWQASLKEVATVTERKRYAGSLTTRTEGLLRGRSDLS